MAPLNAIIKNLRTRLGGYDPVAVAEYRATIKVYDVFIFFNELELLELRLNILAPFVDKFVIVESSKTFAGKDKPLYFAEHRDRFRKFDHQIIHHVVDDMPLDEADLRQRLEQPNISALDREIIQTTLTTDNVPAGQSHWLREFYQKECMKKPLQGLGDTDLCFISDVDEIWNPAAKIDWRSTAVQKMKQLMYAYYLNNRSSEPWAGSFVTTYRTLRTSSINHLDTPTKTRYQFVKNGGWHFTNLGGAERVQAKLESYGHQEFNTAAIKSQLADRIARNEDFIGRQHRFWIDETELPSYLLQHKEHYQALFKI